MRLGWIEIRLRLHPSEWTVECWQWPHRDFVTHYKVKTALFGIQIGPVELRLWVLKPGQYAIVPAGKALPRSSGFLERHLPPLPSSGESGVRLYRFWSL